MEHIADDTRSSEYLANKTLWTFVGCVRSAKIVINDSSLLQLLDKRSTEGWTGKSLGILHVIYFVLNSSGSNKVELMMGIADYLTETPAKRTTSNNHPFYPATKSTLADLCKVYIWFATKVYTLPYFMSVTFLVQVDSFQTIKHLLFNNMFVCLITMPRIRISARRGGKEAWESNCLANAEQIHSWAFSFAPSAAFLVQNVLRLDRAEERLRGALKTMHLSQ